MTQRSGQPGWLVVNADDLGVSRGTTLGILKAHRDGIVTSASIAPAMPHYQFAVESCVRQCPDLGVGLHFTVTSGRPVCDVRRVPLLVDSGGRFRWRFTSLLGAVMSNSQPGLLDQVELEIEAQLDRLRQDGIVTDHVNGERHVQLIPGIFERVVAAARRFGVPYVRAGRDIGPRLLRARDLLPLGVSGGYAKWGLLSGLTAVARNHLKGVASADCIASYLFTGMTGTFLPMLLSSPPLPGVTEVMVHPAMPEEDRELSLGNAEVERYVRSTDRRLELDACQSARHDTGDWKLTTFGRLARPGGA